jgi:hypothetical protein
VPGAPSVIALWSSASKRRWRRRTGEESYLGSKFPRAQAVGAVGLFGLPANLPSNYMHWWDIRWYRVLSVDIKFQNDAMLAHSARQCSHIFGPVFIM